MGKPAIARRARSNFHELTDPKQTQSNGRVWIAGWEGLRLHVPGSPSRTALALLVRQGRLPRPYKLSSGDPGRLFWDLAEVTAAVEALRV